MKVIQEKSEAEVVANAKMTEELNKQKEEVGQSEGLIEVLREATKKMC